MGNEAKTDGVGIFIAGKCADNGVRVETVSQTHSATPVTKHVMCYILVVIGKDVMYC